MARALDETRDELIQHILNHRPERAEGCSLHELFPLAERRPLAIRSHFGQLKRFDALTKLPPTLAMAVIGQAREENRLSAEQEVDLIERLLRKLAMERAPMTEAGFGAS